MTTSEQYAWQMDKHHNDENHLPYPTDAPELQTTSPATGKTVKNMMKLYTTSYLAMMDPQILHSTLMTSRSTATI